MFSSKVLLLDPDAQTAAPVKFDTDRHRQTDTDTDTDRETRHRHR